LAEGRRREEKGRGRGKEGKGGEWEGRGRGGEGVRVGPPETAGLDPPMLVYVGTCQACPMNAVLQEECSTHAIIVVGRSALNSQTTGLD